MNVDFADALTLESPEWGESEWESELAERRRPPSRPGRYTQPPAGTGYVTQSQFQTALDKVRADVTQNSRAIASVGSQVDALSKRTRTEIKTLRDDHTKFRDETRNTLQTLAILPLLSSGGSVKVPNTTPPGGTVTVATPADTLTAMLPLLLLGGFGGGTTSGGTSGSTGGMDSGMLLAVALIASSRKSN